MNVVVASSLSTGLLLFNRCHQQAFRNAIGGGCLFAMADGAAQVLEQQQQRPHYTTTTTTTTTTDTNTTTRHRQMMMMMMMMITQLDYWRLFGAGMLGIFYTSFIYPTTYQILDKAFPGTTWRAVLCKSSVEILTIGVCNNSLSMFTRGYWQGQHDISQILHHVSQEIPVVTCMDARVWFPYNVLAFGWIPMSIRPLTTSALDSFWQTYISSRAHDYKSHEPPHSTTTTTTTTTAQTTTLNRKDSFLLSLPNRSPLLRRVTTDSSRPC